MVAPWDVRWHHAIACAQPLPLYSAAARPSPLLYWCVLGVVLLGGIGGGLELRHERQGVDGNSCTQRAGSARLVRGVRVSQSEAVCDTWQWGCCRVWRGRGVSFPIQEHIQCRHAPLQTQALIQTGARRVRVCWGGARSGGWVLGGSSLHHVCARIVLGVGPMPSGTRG